MRELKGFFIIAVFLVFFPLLAENIPDIARFELEGGISPNSGFGLNTFFSGTVNWNATFSSGLSFFRRDYSVLNSNLEETTVKGDLTTSITLHPIAYKHVVSNFDSVSQSWSIHTSIGWQGTEKVDQFTEIWPDDLGVQQLYLENYKHSSNLLETSLSFSCARTGGMHSWDTGIIVIPWSILFEQYQGFGFTTDPDPLEKKASYDQYFFEPATILFGLGLEVLHDLTTTRIGRWKIDGNLMYRAGSAWIIDNYWDADAETYVFEEYSAIMQLINWQTSLTLYLPVRWMGGIIPGIRVGYYGQIKLVDEFTDELLSFHRLDYGVSFRY